MKVSSSFVPSVSTGVRDDMKRFLSILLIAAGLFGLYADYVNVKDVFACKEYWEETSKKSEDELNALGAGLTKLKKNRKSYNKMVKQLASGKKSLAAKEAKYAAAGAKVSQYKKAYDSEVSAYKRVTNLVKDITSVRTEYTAWKKTYDKLKNDRNAIITSLKGPNPNDNKKTALNVLNSYAVLLATDEERTEYKNALKSLWTNKEQTADGYKSFASNCTRISSTVDSLYKSENDILQAIGIINNCTTIEDFEALNDSPELYETVVLLEYRYQVYLYQNDKGGIPDIDLARLCVDGAKEGDLDDIKEIQKAAKGYEKKDKSNINSLNWTKYYITDNMKTYANSVMQNADKLAAGQDSIAGEVSSIASTILNSGSYRNSVRRSMGKDAITVLENYRKKPNMLNTSSSNFASFEKQMDTNPGLNEMLLKAQKLLTTKKNDVKKAATKAKSTYKAWLKNYKAYPAKLEAAQKKLDDLEKKIADYEKGEKESEKGLAALVNEKPDGDLESIKDRIGGDENFTDNKGNLDVDKGMEAVDAGEAYLNEAGDMIKAELTGRAIGSIAGAVAAILALLAALLSLFRSNRGGAMLACISAVVAAAGAAMGMSSDTVFSELAGSKVGDLPWNAAFVLIGVAIIFAIVHFSAKIEE